jgi:hypothetical protein
MDEKGVSAERVDGAVATYGQSGCGTWPASSISVRIEHGIKTGTVHSSDKPHPGLATGQPRTQPPSVCSGDKIAGHRAGEGLPSSRRHYLNVPRPIRRRVPDGCASRLFTASMAFAVLSAARLPLSPAHTGGTSNDAAGFASCCGPLSCTPNRAFDTGFDPTRYQTEPPVCYRPPGSYPGPDSDRQATTSTNNKITPNYVTRSPPVPLGARKIRASAAVATRYLVTDVVPVTARCRALGCVRSPCVCRRLITMPRKNSN